MKKNSNYCGEEIDFFYFINKQFGDRMDTNEKECIDFLKWIGLYNEENINLIKNGKLLFFSILFAESIVVYDITKNEAIEIDLKNL